MEVQHEVTVHLSAKEVEDIVRNYVIREGYLVKKVNLKVKEGLAYGGQLDPGYPASFTGADVECAYHKDSP